MMARRSSALMAAQPAISSRVRPQPMHRPDPASISQASMQGVSKGGFGPVINQAYVGGEQPRDNYLPPRGSGLGAGSHRAGRALPVLEPSRGLHDPRQRFHDALARKAHFDLRALAKTALQLERAVMQLGQSLGDGKPKPGATFRRLMGKRSLAEALQHAGDLVLGNARPGILDAQKLPSGLGLADGERDRSARRGELDRIRQQVEADLAHGPLVGPELRKFRLELLDDAKGFGLGA